MEFKKFVRIRREKFGAVVFDTLREKVLVANQAGAAILELLESGELLENIPQLLANKYDGDYFQIKQDAINFVKELEERELLVQ